MLPIDYSVGPWLESKLADRLCLTKVIELQNNFDEPLQLQLMELKVVKVKS